MCVIALAIGESVREPRRNLSQEAESSLIGMNYQFVLIFGDFKREEVQFLGGFRGLTTKVKVQSENNRGHDKCDYKTDSHLEYFCDRTSPLIRDTHLKRVP